MRVPLASLGKKIHRDRKSAISKRPNEHLPLPVFQFPSEDDEIGSRCEGERAIQDVSQYCRSPGPWGGRDGERRLSKPLSPQNSTGNRILRASNDNLASVVYELGRRERIELMRRCERREIGRWRNEME